MFLKLALNFYNPNFFNLKASNPKFFKPKALLPIAYSPKLEGARSGGFSLIEILVTVILILIGIVGIAKLQGSSLLMGKDSHSIDAATFAATSMIDRIRSNTQGLEPTPKDALMNSYVGNVGLGVTKPPCVPNCTGNQLAQADKYAWFQMLNDLLPNPTASITKKTVATNPASPSVFYQLTITWSPIKIHGDRADPNNFTDTFEIKQYTTEFMP